MPRRYQLDYTVGNSCSALKIRGFGFGRISAAGDDQGSVGQGAEEVNKNEKFAGDP